MTENKRYFKKEYDEEYYIFDSETISKSQADEEAEYSYDVFAESLTSDEIVNKLNYQHETIQFQHETIQFQQKQTFCLQSVIQTIDAELQEKGMTKERLEEIKDYWYEKVMLE